MTVADPAMRARTVGVYEALRGRGDRIMVVAAGLGLLHHLDHVLRYDHSGWPFRPEASPFTYSLVAYPVIALILAARGHPRIQAALTAAAYAVTQAAHVFVEPPTHQYGTWARGYGITPSGATPDNLLQLASPVAGVLSAALAVALSLTLIAAIIAYVADAKAQQ